jgi:hypothetical protein
VPRYTFLNSETQEEFDVDVKMADYDEYVKANPNFSRVYSSAAHIGDPVLQGVTKTPDSWKSLLKHVNRQHRNLFSGGTKVEIR